MQLILWTVLFIIGGACACRTLFQMLQPEEMVEQLFPRFRLWMDKMYSGTPKQKLLEKVLGGCAKCTSFWFAMIWFVAYAVFCNCYLGIWIITGSGLAMTIFVNFIWWSMVVNIMAAANYIATTK